MAHKFLIALSMLAFGPAETQIPTVDSGAVPASEMQALASEGFVPAAARGEAPSGTEGEEPLDARPSALDRVHPAWRDFLPEWRSELCPFAPRIEFDKNRIECGYVLVPENRRDPDSRLIRLSVARVEADSEQPPAGTSVWLQGGPGPAATPVAPQLLNSTSTRARNMRKASHWLFPDYRGVGFSEPYFCRGIHTDLADEAPYTPAGRTRIEADLRACLEIARLRGIDVDAYTTWDSAMDMRDIRRALGLEQWNLFGTSYGTELAQMVLQVDEAGTRSAILDSVVAPPPLSWDRFSFGMESALNALNQACSENGRCAERFGDLEQLARRAVDAYRDAPIAVDGIDPYVSPSGTLVLNHHLSAWGLFQALYNRDLYPALPALFEAWAELDDERLRAYVEQMVRPPSPDWGHGYSFVAECSGSVAMDAASLDAPRGHASFWGEALVDGQISRSCAALGLLAPDRLMAPPQTDVPILVAAGSVDPITPPDFAKAILPGLVNATYIELPYTGHGATAPDCAAGIMHAFLLDPRSRLDTACIEEIQAPAFVTDYKSTLGPLRLLAAVREGNYLSLAWGVLPALVLLGAVFAFPLAAIGRRVDGRSFVARRPRLLAWLAALLGLLGIVLLAMAFQQTVTVSPALIPLGLVGPTGPATASLFLALLAALAAVWSLRRHERAVGTMAGVALTALSVILVLAFTVQRGLVL